jgi:hypothetical protein
LRVGPLATIGAAVVAVVEIGRYWSWSMFRAAVAVAGIVAALWTMPLRLGMSQYLQLVCQQAEQGHPDREVKCEDAGMVVGG